MEVNKKIWPILSVSSIRDRIDTNPDYQRPAVWTLSQKELLIDTILRGYDIPKIYLRQTSKNPDKYEVIDGQQRLRTIFEFLEGKFALGKYAEKIDGHEVINLKYKDSKNKNILNDDLKIKIDTYQLDIVILTNTNDDEVREMFLRFQNGTTLKAQEKRNAMPGKMRDFIKKLSKHEFFKKVNFKNSRFTFDHISSQFTKIEIEGEACNIKSADLDKMYIEQKNFNHNSKEAKKVIQVLEYMNKCFLEKTPELERYSVVSLYILFSHLIEKYSFKELTHKQMRDWFINFEKYRIEQNALDQEEQDQEMIVYHEKISHSTDAVDSLKSRHEILFKNFLIKFPTLSLKDNTRSFSHHQRLAIYRRDGGKCKLKIKCSGEKCSWDNWEADHIKAWDKGGATTVKNGQVACPKCNKTKGNR
jgi:hypothetical protein